MKLIVHIILTLVYLLLLFVAITMLCCGYICDEQTCHIFTNAFLKLGSKNQIINLLENLCEDSMWPIAYITASILSGLFFSILPVPLTVECFAIIFLLTFITFYCILSFAVYHYVVPVKKYIIDYIRNIDENL